MSARIPACSGSPVSLVATGCCPWSVGALPVRTMALAKASFGGALTGRMNPSAMLPESPRESVDRDLVGRAGDDIEGHLARVAGAAVVIARDESEGVDRAAGINRRAWCRNYCPRWRASSLPVAGAVHRHQTDLPPLLLAWFGSPVSLVAPAFVPLVEGAGPVRTMALAKLSLGGGATNPVTAQNDAVPEEAKLPSTAM